MAKSTPPSEESEVSPSTRRSRTDELTARANRAAERPPGKPLPGTEVVTEILDQSMLPDDDDETRVEDPVEEDRRRVEKARRQEARQRAAEKARQEEARQRAERARQEEARRAEKARQEEARRAEEARQEEARRAEEARQEEARQRAEKARQKADAPPEDLRKAEHLLESFLAAHERAKISPPKPVEPSPARKPTERAPPRGDGEEPSVSGISAAALPSGALPPPRQSGVLFALNQAQPPGVYFVEHQPGQGDGGEDPALAAAVDEAIGVLFGVRGIHHIGPGHNEAGEPVVVIAAGQDFGEAALQQIPANVGNFRTLVTVPFELLPLRRNR